MEDVKKVLDSNADVNMQDVNGMTALHYASEWGNIEAVRMLLEYGADPDIKDNDGRTALQRARNKKIENLLSKPVSSQVNDKNESTNEKLISVCSEWDDYKVDLEELERLLATGADINYQSEWSRN